MNSYILTALAEAYGAHEGITHWAVSYRMMGKGDFLRRLENGHDCTMRTYERALQWFSDHWPPDLPWPPDIPRPAPDPSVNGPSVYRNAPEPPADPLEAEAQAIEAAMALNADGLLANPNALCAALRQPRYVYDQVVRRYADGKPGERKVPTRLKHGKSPTQRMLEVLVASGDVRFESRRALAALLEV